jgi:hypothetical protein
MSITPEVLERFALELHRSAKEAMKGRASFASFSLSPMDVPTFAEVHLHKRRYDEFRLMYSALLGFAAVVTDVHPEELSPEHLTHYLWKLAQGEKLERALAKEQK